MREGGTECGSTETLKQSTGVVKEWGKGVFRQGMGVVEYRGVGVMEKKETDWGVNTRA